MYKYTVSFITLLFITVTQTFALSPWEPPFGINSIQQTSENIIISGGSGTVRHDRLSLKIFHVDDIISHPHSDTLDSTSFNRLVYESKEFATNQQGIFEYNISKDLFKNESVYEVALLIHGFERERETFIVESGTPLCEVLNNCLPQESKITSISDGFHPVITGVSRSLTNLELQIDELIPPIDSIHSHGYTKVYGSSRENFMIDSKGGWVYNIKNNNIFQSNRIYLVRFLENGREVDSKRFIFEYQQNLTPTCTLTASEVSIIQGENTEIRWFTQNADVVTLTRLTTGSTEEVSKQGTRFVSPNTTEKFIINATNTIASTQCSVNIIVSKQNTEPTIVSISDDFNPVISGTASSARNLEITIDKLVAVNDFGTLRHDRVYTSLSKNFVMDSKGGWFYKVENDGIFERGSMYYIQLRYNGNYAGEKTFVYGGEIIDMPYVENVPESNTSRDNQLMHINLSTRDQRMADRVVDLLSAHLNSSLFSGNNRYNEIMLIRGRLENLTNHSRFSNIAWYLIDSLEALR